MSAFTDQVGLVVGGARGIGRAVAEALARAGTHVAIADLGCETNGQGRDPNVAIAAAADLERLGVKSLALPLDSAELDSARAMLETTQDALGGVTHGVYCAGYHHERPLLRDSNADLSRVLEVHLLGAIRFVRTLAGAMISDKRSGRIVVASSAAAFFGSAGQTALATAAGGLVGFVRTAATELRRHGIRLNAVVPTARTRLTEKLPLFESIRLDSLTPEHVAQVVLHLLSDAAQDIHGEVIGVAGGRVYALRHVETSGAFFEGPPPDLAAIEAAWREVSRR